MHKPVEKFIVYQIKSKRARNWAECSKIEHDLNKGDPAQLVRRLAVMPEYEIVAKRWQDGDGNTQHSVRLYRIADSYELIGVRPYEYGYGDQWQVTAAELVNEMLPDVFPKLDRASGHAGAYLRDECNIVCNVTDVNRKKDM